MKILHQEWSIESTIVTAMSNGLSINELIETLRERDDKKWPKYGVKWGLKFKETYE